MSNWTDDKPARLRIMWAEGQSTRTISNELGFTRNAVVGKAHRRSPASRDLQAQKRLCIIRRGVSTEVGRDHLLRQFRRA